MAIELENAVVDSEAAAPSGAPCNACGTPVEALDKFCPACGTTNPRYQAQASGPGALSAPASGRVASPEVIAAEIAEPSPLSKYFRCQQCGSEVATDPSQR